MACRVSFCVRYKPLANTRVGHVLHSRTYMVAFVRRITQNDPEQQVEIWEAKDVHHIHGF